MDWTQTYTILGVTAGLFLALLGVMISLFIYLAGKIDHLRQDIYADMKDFHGRMCAIEERYHIKRHGNN